MVKLQNSIMNGDDVGRKSGYEGVVGQVGECLVIQYVCRQEIISEPAVNIRWRERAQIPVADLDEGLTILEESLPRC
jgi:hypothetical protein